MERGVAPTNCVGRVCTNSRAWLPSSSTKLPCASLTVNTGYVERRAGLNWHQLPAKHPPRTFHPPLLSPPLSLSLSLSLWSPWSVDARCAWHPLHETTLQKRKSTPKWRNDITLWKYTFPADVASRPDDVIIGCLAVLHHDHEFWKDKVRKTRLERRGPLFFRVGEV